MDAAITFNCGGEQLIGIVSSSSTVGDVGVLVLVGGPQYRVGSHRQFVLLARRLACAGVAVMRFDYRGMGDSGGTAANFEQTSSDVTEAIRAFRQECPSVRRIVLWGLCDAASAALLYCRSTQDTCIAGLVLLNPWVRSEQSLATTHVKHYYSARIFERQFWAKLVRGGIDVRHACREFARALLAARRSAYDANSQAEGVFQDRMAAALAAFSGPVLIVLSGNDYVAKEFVEYTTSNARWEGLESRQNIERIHLSDADHTFSTAAWRKRVEELTLEWLKRSFGIVK